MPPPQRAKPVRKSARGGVADGSPRPHPPHPQPVGSGLRPHALKDEWSGLGERPTPDAPHPGKRRLPGAPWCRPHSAKSQLARARAVGLVTGPHARIPRTHSQWVFRPRPHARKDEWSGVGERPTPDAPYPGKRRPPRGPWCCPHSAQSQLARARAVGLVTGLHASTPRTHSQWVFRPRPHARKDEWSGVGERPTPDAPYPGKRRPPWAPTCRPHSGQSQLARARAVSWVTGPHARTPCTHSQWVVSPGRTPQGTGGRGWESAQSRTPRQDAPPPRHPHAIAIARKASSQECALWAW